MLKSKVEDHTFSSKSKTKRKIKLIAKDDVSDQDFGLELYKFTQKARNYPRNNRQFKLNKTTTEEGKFGDQKSRLLSSRKYKSPEDLAMFQAETLILNLRVLSTLSNQLGGRY